MTNRAYLVLVPEGVGVVQTGHSDAVRVPDTATVTDLSHVAALDEAEPIDRSRHSLAVLIDVHCDPEIVAELIAYHARLIKMCLTAGVDNDARVEFVELDDDSYLRMKGDGWSV